MKISITESGATFGPFDREDLFELERILTNLNFGDDVSKVEFVINADSGKSGVVRFVEAKSSIPRESGVFLDEIRQKMNHAVAVWMGALTGRHPEVQPLLPPNLSQIEHARLPIGCYLVIPGVPDAMLPPITDKFRQSMKSERRIWAIRSEHIQVLNTSKARKIGLIVTPTVQNNPA
jgi:hypothetical protein